MVSTHTTTAAAGLIALGSLCQVLPTQPMGTERSRTPIVPMRKFISDQRAIDIGMVDYAHHALNPTLMGFIARNYDSFVSGDQNLDFSFYHTANSQLKVFSYFNSFMLGLDQPAPTDERAYLHDGSVPVADYNASNRLGKFFEGDFYFVMDPASPLWQSFARAQIQSVIDQGFDGVVIDDVFAHLMHEAHFNADEPLVIGTPGAFTAFSTVPGWYAPQASHDGWREMLGFLDAQLVGDVIYNGINDLAENFAPIDPALHPIDYLNATDGAIQEGFVYNSKWVVDPADAFLGDEYWEATVQVLMDIPLNKRHSIVSYGDPNYWPARIYALASYLIGYNPQGKDSFYYAPDEFTLTRLPEWSLDLGEPTDSFATLAQYKETNFQVFVRHFSNAVVIVNPYGTGTGAIPLGERYFEVMPSGTIAVANMLAIGAPNALAFTARTTITLPAYSATILMKP